MMGACVRGTALAGVLGLMGLGLAAAPAVAAGSAATAGWQISYQKGYFSAASASSASDVWAISSSCEGCGTFAGRWNGTAWSWNAGVASAYSVAALSGSDVWVAAQAGLEHWNGHSWRTYTAPGPNGVSSVSGVAADEVWAAGLASNGLQPEAAFWNGKSWSLQTLPTIKLPTNGQALPEQVVADAQNNVWMEGYVQWPDPTTQLEDYKPFVLHYNGSKWTVEALPAIPDSTPGTTSVTGLFQVPGTGRRRRSRAELCFSWWGAWGSNPEPTD
jgi:hypothetical protein